MTVCVATIIKDESRYLKEWVQYNLDYGVDHIYILQDVSSEIEYQMSKSILSEFIKNDAVTLQDGRQVFPATVTESYARRQRPWFNHVLQAVKTSRMHKWILPIDVDEFFVPLEDETITDFVARFDPDAVLGIVLYQIPYGHGNTADIPALAPESVVETSLSALRNVDLPGAGCKTISSVKSAEFLHVHCPGPNGDLRIVTATGKVVDWNARVAEYDVAYYGHFIQRSLEALNNKFRNAMLWPVQENGRRPEADIAMNRFTNNDWVNFPLKNSFDPSAVDTTLRDRYRRRKNLVALEAASKIELMATGEPEQETVEIPLEQIGPGVLVMDDPLLESEPEIVDIPSETEEELPEEKPVEPKKGKKTSQKEATNEPTE